MSLFITYSKFNSILSSFNNIQIRSSCKNNKKPLIITKQELKRFIEDCMVSVGTCKQNASILATVLITADERGYYSHGVNRLAKYVNDVKDCMVDGAAKPDIESESPGTAWVNGNDALGPVVGQFSMDLAIKKAKDVGVGWIAAYRSAHYGIASYYTILAMKKGFIGFSCTNTSPMMVPFGAKEVALGSNPLSVAAPSEDCTGFILDMATTYAAKGKIEVALREGKEIPKGWVQDADGKPITDPKKALAYGGLLPIGGTKGTGLALLVELFSGILAGGNYGPNIPKWGKSKEKSNICHSFVALDPKCFAPDFEERMADLMNIIRNLKSVKGGGKVMVPGDPENLHMQKVAKNCGIEYTAEIKEQLDCLAEELEVDPVKLQV